MKKFFSTRLAIYMLAALLITIAAIFSLQTFVSNSTNTTNSNEKLVDVEGKLQDNQAEVKLLTNALGESNLAKSRAFADLLATDPTILESNARLLEVMEELMVDELHVIDTAGIITHSTVDAYIGFDMTIGEQSRVFMEIVDNPSLEIVQEPQENAAEGILMQYIGVVRKDAPGLVQVGIRPEALETMLAGTALNVVLNDIDFGDTGYIYAVDASTGEILAHPDDSLVGTMASDAGLPITTGNGSATVAGTKGFYVAQEYDGKYIGTFMPSSEYYADRMSQTVVVSLSMFVIFTILLLMIRRLVDTKIVKGILNIANAMNDIAHGNYNVTVDEKGNREFEMLSKSINTMVAGIKENIDENEALLAKQKEDMANNLSLIESIKTTCEMLNLNSRDTTANADDIYNGTEEQKQAVADLQQIMTELVNELNSSAEKTAQVSTATENAVDRIRDTKDQMEQLKNSMERISEMTSTIEKIIAEIDSIAQQTNMLSLNASIEAARAGDMGKGFAVVAAQVGELAARSAQAAKQTNELITNSIHAVEEGHKITDNTANAFNNVVAEIETANQNVEEITDMVRQNVAIVSKAVDEINLISGVVEKNVEISHNSKQVSASLADETNKLLQMVEE